ncbi:MAG: HAMP domain-containing protein [Armatimonadota bacterium]|nr:MAG: HAMP domain-containing protein [Armatimonadota bacterium]
MINLRISARLIGGFLVVVGLIGVIGVIALDGLRDVSARYQDALDAYCGQAVAGLELKAAVLQHVRAQKNYLLRGDPEYLTEARGEAQRMRAARLKLEAATRSRDDLDLLRQLDERVDLLDQTFRASVATRQAQGIEEADAAMRGKAAAVTAVLDDFVARAEEGAQREAARAQDQARRTGALTVILIVCLGLLALFLGLVLSLSVTRPLGRLQSQIDAVAQGRAAPPEPAAEGRDEVAQIARAFHELVQEAALLREMEARSKRLEEFSSRVARAQEEERELIARELHDGLGQALTAIKLDLAAAARAVSPEAEATREHLLKAQRLADEGIDELRRLAFDLRPAALDNLGLVAALESYARGFKDRGVTVAVEADAFEPRLPFEVETALYRICQEALTNISKHAQASHAVVRLRREPDTVRLTVTDDGVGFDTAAVTRSDGTLKGIGLLSMERRAEELGGTFRIESAPGRGTTVYVTVPRRPQRQV